MFMSMSMRVRCYRFESGCFTGLSFDRRIGKLMLFGAIFRCLDSALTIAGECRVNMEL